MTDRAKGARRFDVSRVIFYFLLTCGLLGLTFAAGLHAGANKTHVYVIVTAFAETISRALTLTAREAPTALGIRPHYFLQESRYEGSGVTVNDLSSDQDDLILLSGFFTYTNELRLIRRNGDVVARWPVSYRKLFPNTDFFPKVDPEILPEAVPPSTDWNIDTHGALALPDGSVVFNFERAGTVKLDRCGNVVWTIRRRTHHSIERAEGGGFVVPGRRVILDGPSPFPPYPPPFEEDTILRISEDGQVLSETSVPEILYRNGLEAVLTATNQWLGERMTWGREIVHLNKIDELTSDLANDFPMFDAGDLMLSIRGQNMIVVVDKTGSRVKWWKIGPWLRQHDPEFMPGGKIVLFNNNIYSGWIFASGDQRTPASTPRVSNITEVDPATGDTRVLFGGKPDQELLTIVRGKVDGTPRGGLLITEQEGGRAIETDANGRVVWQYLNRYSAREMAEINEARLYPSSYFTVKDWSCASPRS